MKGVKELHDKLWKEIVKNIQLDEDPSSGLLKAMEELGELAEVSMAMKGGRDRTKFKLTNEELKEKFAEELVDTIITLLNTAKAQKIDIWKKLKKKMLFEIERWEEFGK